MAFFPQRLTRSSLYEQPAITIQHLTSEVLPFYASALDYAIDAHTFSAYGTSTDSLLRLRRPKRLVVSRSKKPQQTVPRKAWPDPRNAKEVALFHQKHLASRQDTHPAQSVKCKPATGSLFKQKGLMTSGSTISTSNHSRLVIPPPPRFPRHANERSLSHNIFSRNI